MKNILVAVIMTVPSILYSQTILSRRILWKSDQQVEIPSGTMSKELSTVVFYKNDSIIWREGSGKLKAKFVIKSTGGNLTDLKGTGNLIYQIISGETNGTIALTMNSNHATLRIMMIDKGGPRIKELYIKEPIILK